MTRHQLRALPMVVLLITIAVLLVASLTAGRKHAESPPARDTAELSWGGALRAMDDALSEGNISAAVRASHEAYLAALASRSWEAMIAVGDGYLRLGDASGSMRTARSKARTAYLTAVYRAQAAGVVNGVLHAGQAFETLGDHDVVLMCLRIAENMAPADDGEKARIRAFANRIGRADKGT